MSDRPHLMGAESEMLPLFQARTQELQRRLKDKGIDMLIITNIDSIYYYSAYWGILASNLAARQYSLWPATAMSC